MVIAARINLWKALVGAVLWDPKREIAVLEFDPAFVKSGMDLAPLRMPLAALRDGQRIFSFPGLSKVTYRGLPGLVADSLPDRFGSDLLNAWLAAQGRNPDSVNPIERLCYTGRRGMGALEYEPANHPADADTSSPLDIRELVKLARQVLAKRGKLKANLGKKGADGLLNIIKVGASAGGARAKAIIAYNEKTGAVRSGQVEAPRGFSHWLIKFDGVTNRKLGDPAGFGRIEFAYHRMAAASGIAMTPCRVHEENGRAHFMTRRFDREGNEKVHMQTLCALAHFDFNESNAYSYEQAFQVMRQLRLPFPDAEQLYARMVFNVVAGNQDDHTKNISFLMDKAGNWALSPAYDLTNANDPKSKWVHRHQMSVNGKREKITRNDLVKVAKEMNIKSHREIIGRVVEAVSNWARHAKEAGVPKNQAEAIRKDFLLKI